MERAEIIDLLRRFGTPSVDAILDATTEIFSDPHIEGIIGYRPKSNYYIVYGDPIATEENKKALATAFHKHCEEQKKHIIYIGSSESFSKWAIKNICSALITFGETLYYNPQVDPMEQTGSHGKLVRQKAHHASKENVKVTEYKGNDPKLEESLIEVGNQWLKHRKGLQIHISQLRLFEDRISKRWFYASKNGSIMGVLMINEIEPKKYLLSNLVTAPNAPNGTSESLIVTAFETLAKEGCSYVTSGSAPTITLHEIEGFNPFFKFLIKNLYFIATRLFHFTRLKTFWSKFCPQSEATYLLFSDKKIGIRAIIGVLKALNVSL